MKYDSSPVKRIRVWYVLLMCLIGLFVARLFYLQVIRYDHFKASALSDQLKQYQIPATRGTISAYSGGTAVPLVLNQKLFLVFADPVYVKDIPKTAAAVAGVTGGQASAYEKLLKDGAAIKGKRYVVLDKKLSQAQGNKITGLKLPGLGSLAQEYRTYPQGAMAAQTLGFVNDDGVGTYGIEQALNTELKGTPGELKAITDVHGVPLAASRGNISKPAVSGKDLTLTLDLSIQKNLEKILADGVKNVSAEGGSAVVIDPQTGAVKAMANVPTYDPTKYSDVDDASVFTNKAVANAIEVGSVMKPLTTAAALDSGAVKINQTYYDPFQYTVDGFKITNIEEDGSAGTKSLADILNLSLNTGVTWELMQMGGGSLNQKARDTWYSYMGGKYRFGQETGIEQGYESAGLVPKPKDNGAGINLTYANTAFGQAMTATPLQMASALASVVNGGTYYQPHLVDGKPKVLGSNVVTPTISGQMIGLMQYTVDHHTFSPAFDQTHYIVGGKTGTAQIAGPDGKYLENDYNGTYVGFVGGDKPRYVMAVAIYKPKVASGAYAGTAAAQPVFGAMAHMLINNSFVAAKN